ncbi:LysM peptidoglycan-binding domain-containing protein [Rossellomorea aquimaris]|uniref:3D domain-containing protein n=1 Tax=Rossellomorea aquimaris TaxID=189382 RepID=UPI003CF210FB
MKLKKSIISVAAFTTLAVSGGASASAQDIEVKKGDTLWGIAQEYGTSVDKLMKWNNLNSHLIYPDQELTVSSKEYYTVKKGDTLWGISSQYGVSVDSLIGWNALESDLIVPGQELVLNLEDKKAPSATANTSEQAAAPAQEETAEVAPEAEAPAAEPDAQEEAVKEITVEATAYTASCEGCSGTTATGVNLLENPDAKVIAVDPDVIPLGSKVFVEGYGYATAEDTGGAIKGNRIDVFIPSKDQAVDWGRKSVNVKILESK